MSDGRQSRGRCDADPGLFSPRSNQLRIPIFFAFEGHYNFLSSQLGMKPGVLSKSTPQPDSSSDGPVVFITGAASGIGRSTVFRFFDAGYRILASDRDLKGLRLLEEAVRKRDNEGITASTSHGVSAPGKFGDESIRITAVLADLRNEEQIRDAVQVALSVYGRLDAAVNNAGISGPSTRLHETGTQEWDELMEINLRGPFLGMKAQIEAMLELGSGSIVNVSSILGVVGYEHASAYTTSKHGLIGLTRTAALEYAKDGIRINAVCPGFIVTPMLEHAGLLQDSATRKYLESLHPLNRFGRDLEVANAIYWLCSQEASFVTGEALMVDGGYTAK